MKKFAMAVAAASLLSAGYAESCASAFTGAYAGAQVGFNNLNSTLNMSGYNISTDPVNSTRTYKGSAGNNSFLGGIFAGYGMGVGSCTYVGGEVYVNFGNNSATLFDSSQSINADRTFVVKYTSNYSLGAKLRLGYTVSQQALIFLGLGLDYSKNQLKVTNVANGQTNSQVTGALVTTKKKSQISFAPSVGMDILLNKNLFVRGEYTYVLGGTITANPLSQNSGAGAASVQTGTVKAKVTQQRFVLGLGYKF